MIFNVGDLVVSEKLPGWILHIDGQHEFSRFGYDLLDMKRYDAHIIGDDENIVVHERDISLYSGDSCTCGQVGCKALI